MANQSKKGDSTNALIKQTKLALEKVRGRWKDISNASGVDLALIYRISNSRSTRYDKDELKTIISECDKYYELYGDKR